MNLFKEKKEIDKKDEYDISYWIGYIGIKEKNTVIIQMGFGTGTILKTMHNNCLYSASCNQ